MVRSAIMYGYDARFRTLSPCCNRGALVDAAMWAGVGAPFTCPGCGWKWHVYLAFGDERLGVLPRDAKHPQIKADRAEWVSEGFGTRAYRRRTPSGAVE